MKKSRKKNHCAICLQKNCDSRHYELVNYLIATEEGFVLSKGGQKKYGTDYLEVLRKDKDSA